MFDLPQGATVLGFRLPRAYRRRPSRCRGASVDGRIVPLTYQPAAGAHRDATSVENRPRRDPAGAAACVLAHTHCARARRCAPTSVISTMKSPSCCGLRHPRSASSRLALAQFDLDTLPPRFPPEDPGRPARGPGPGDVSQRSWRAPCTRSSPRARCGAAGGTAASAQGREPRRADHPRRATCSPARCCQPLPGDPILGFITRGRGVSASRRLSEPGAPARPRPRRVIEVEWGSRREQAYEVDVLVKGYDPSGCTRTSPTSSPPATPTCWR